ncbi:Polyketide cyclase / dehydrase and lipid transport [Tranquillimonas rosea]|uniref:Polyketide cyclase / dehydrase and lipid transport n=1 Tax=Tranquillimonas rosea TaxID=641238 RepID=A0A1H9SNH1_9RHOB|nr:SRPBCC family protein [Tranquillimonas rosea]SER85923.1 Polyketide cyclase / dehydrase and lipid transport [Tranquillimonas rosea]
MASVYVSDIVNAPADKVWALARDYNGHGEWHPRIAESSIEDDLSADQVGCVRNFTLSDGGHLRERLLSFSDLDRAFTYTILVSPMPITDYVATFRCTPVTERDATFVEWWATFEVDEKDEADIRHAVGRETFAAGIRALADRLE